MTSQSWIYPKALQDYLHVHLPAEPAAFSACRAQTQKMPAAKMQISPEQGQFMAVLLQAINAKHVLEFGTFTGYSTMVMADALPENGHVVTLDKNPEWTKHALKTWEAANLQHKITLKLGCALETAQALLESHTGYFDFIFIDADKINYLAYYELSLKLIKLGGVIAIDNTLWQGQLWDEIVQDENTNAIRAFNDALAKDARVCTSIVPIGDGLTLVYTQTTGC